MSNSNSVPNALPDDEQERLNRRTFLKFAAATGGIAAWASISVYTDVLAQQAAQALQNDPEANPPYPYHGSA